MKKIINTLFLTTIFILAFGTVSFAAMPNGTVILENKAYDLNYANDTSNADEITQPVTGSGNIIYVKMFDGSWIDNNTNKTINASNIPAVTYKDTKGIKTNYKAADGDVDTTKAENLNIELIK